MLQPSVYPEDHPPLIKFEQFRKQSEYLGENNFYRAPLTTFFHNGRNHVGVGMKANRGSGDECTGLNDGSKNSVVTTYLTDAWNWGAEIFCMCEVSFVEKAAEGNGYHVYFAWHGSGRSSFREDAKHHLFWVKAVCYTTANNLYSSPLTLSLHCV